MIGISPDGQEVTLLPQQEQMVRALVRGSPPIVMVHGRQSGRSTVLRTAYELERHAYACPVRTNLDFKAECWCHVSSKREAADRLFDATATMISRHSGTTVEWAKDTLSALLKAYGWGPVQSKRLVDNLARMGNSGHIKVTGERNPQ